MKCRGVAQTGSAPAWGAGGRRFKSSRPDHSKTEYRDAANPAEVSRTF